MRGELTRAQKKKKLKLAQMKGDTPLEQWLNYYLTTQFIGTWSDLPKDECLSEAKHILGFLAHVLKPGPKRYKSRRGGVR